MVRNVEETVWAASVYVTGELSFSLGEYRVLYVTDDSCVLKTDSNLILNIKNSK
jgi:hypothetical protein